MLPPIFLWFVCSEAFKNKYCMYIFLLVTFSILHTNSCSKENYGICREVENRFFEKYIQFLVLLYYFLLLQFWKRNAIFDKAVGK